MTKTISKPYTNYHAARIKVLGLFTRLKYISENWKIGTHLIFRTKRFGVNNQWWAPFDSIFAVSFWQRLCIIENWKEMKFRAGACHFVTDEQYKLIFGKVKGK